VTAAGRCAAQTGKEAASPPLTFRNGLPRSRPGDTPRKDTGPPLSVKAGCDHWATATRKAARHTYTPSPALSAEPPAVPGGRKAGRPSLPPPSARRVRCPVHQATRNARSMKSELAFDNQKKAQITRIHYP
jgi:hypothetical protein